MSAESNSIACVDCGTGKKSDPGSAKCQNCDAGEAGTGLNGVCAPCDRGKYRNSGMTDTTKCEPCPAGSYQNETGQASCLPCIPVSFHLLLPPSVFIIPVVHVLIFLFFLFNYFYTRVHLKRQLVPMSATNAR